MRLPGADRRTASLVLDSMLKYRVNFDSAGQPTSATVPRYAFKFATANEGTLTSLSESYLWFSRPGELNDLFELPSKVPTSFEESDVRAYLRANITHHWANFGLAVPTGAALETFIDRLLGSHPEFAVTAFRKLQEARREKVRIHCLSLRYDDPLMWAHYAASYSGVCLVYDFPQLAQAGPWFAVQVMYVDAPPIYDPIAQSLAQLTALSPYENYAAHFEHDQLQFGTKLRPWSHEQEIRLCTLRPEAKHSYAPSALLGVILGPRLQPTLATSVRRAAATGREHVRIEYLVVDDDKDLLLVPGLENYNVDLPISNIRNLARELKREDIEYGRDA